MNKSVQYIVLVIISTLITSFCFAQNKTTQQPISMQQLMRELRIQGGNWNFKFDRPVYAKVIFTVSSFPDGKKVETTEFISNQSNSEIDLFFMASAAFVGDYTKPNQRNDKKMKIKISNCAETAGTRIIHYVDKFAQHPWITQKGEQGEYSPCLPLNPELKKEYILHYYYKVGDPYEAKATICFVEKKEDLTSVKKYDRNSTRSWKSAEDE